MPTSKWNIGPHATVAYTFSLSHTHSIEKNISVKWFLNDARGYPTITTIAAKAVAAAGWPSLFNYNLPIRVLLAVLILEWSEYQYHIVHCMLYKTKTKTKKIICFDIIMVSFVVPFSVPGTQFGLRLRCGGFFYYYRYYPFIVGTPWKELLLLFTHMTEQMNSRM